MTSIQPPGGVNVTQPVPDAPQRTVADLYASGFAPPEPNRVIENPFAPPPVPAIPPPVRNKYAPSGWRKKQSVEFDLTVPSGQTCRLRRLERNDIFKLKIVDHLDKLLPMLIDVSDGEDREAKIKQAMQNNAHLIDDMYTVIDVVTMACCINPMITTDRASTLYGDEKDWENPEFIAVVHIDDIQVEDRMAIFAAAFGDDASQLKSVGEPQAGMESATAIKDVQLSTELNS